MRTATDMIIAWCLVRHCRLSAIALPTVNDLARNFPGAPACKRILLMSKSAKTGRTKELADLRLKVRYHNVEALKPLCRQRAHPSRWPRSRHRSASSASTASTR
jgi:hypothetical protein